MYIVEIEHTLHPGGRSTKKRQWEIYKTPLRNKNSPKRISRWYTHSSKQDYIQTEWIECTNEWKKNAILPSVYADLNLSFIINYTPSSARRSFFCCAKITNVTSFNCNLRSRKGNNLRKLAIAFCQPFFFSIADSQTARLGFYGLLAVG